MLLLNYRDSRPIYGQIKDGLRRLIVTGALAAGEKLPSVRSLATDLAINPNTIQRAYAELEREGFIYSVLRTGLSPSDRRLGAPARRDSLIARLRELVAELRYLGVADRDILALMGEGSGQ